MPWPRRAAPPGPAPELERVSETCERLQLGFLAMPDAVPRIERLAQLTESAFAELSAALAPPPAAAMPALRSQPARPPKPRRAEPVARKTRAALAA